MADTSAEDVASSSLPDIPEDVLFFLSKYLNPRSSMAVALSGAFEGFDVLLGGNRLCEQKIFMYVIISLNHNFLKI